MKAPVPLFISLVAIVILSTLSSASILPRAIAPAPPIEKKVASKKVARKAARLQRLQKRYEHAVSFKVRARLQHKMHQLQEGKEATTLEILALVFAFVFPPVGLILAIIAKKNGGGDVANVAFWVSLVQVILIALLLILALLISVLIVGNVGGI